MFFSSMYEPSDSLQRLVTNSLFDGICQTEVADIQIQEKGFQRGMTEPLGAPSF